METYLLFALIGLGAGAVYAGLSLGLVVVFKGTGVVNFAQGALAMWGAYVYSELRSSGDFVLPLVGIPHRVRLSETAIPVAPALLIGVASAAGVALVAQLLVFRPLRSAPQLAKLVASVGVMLSLQAIAALEFGSEQRVVRGFLPSGRVQLAGLAIPVDRFFLAGLAIAAALVLWAWFRFARLGLAIRAAAENERAASLAGFSPDRLAAAAWVVSGALAGLFGILVVPVTGLNTVNFTLFVLPALAAALVGRFTSLGAACAAGLGLGMAQSELLYLQTQSWYPDWAVSGASEALPFLVIISVLFLFGRSLPSRGSVERDRLPEVIRPTHVVVPVLAWGAVATAALLVLDDSYRFGLVQSMILATVMLSFVVLTGLVGQLSLAQAAFAGIAGFMLSKLGATTGIPFPLSVVIAAAAATCVGLVAAIPALRIRGTQLAVVTLGIAVATAAFVFDNPSFTPREGNVIPDPSFLGVGLGIRGDDASIRLRFALLALALLMLVAVAVGNLTRGETGRRLLAVRSNERAAAAVGVSPSSAKLLAFGVSAFVAGLGGAMLGYSRGQLSAASFDAFAGLQLFVFAYLGGIASISGAVVAGLLAPLGLAYVALNRIVDLGSYYLLASGLSVIAIAIFNPEGIAGAFHGYAVALRRRPPRSKPRPPVEAAEAPLVAAPASVPPRAARSPGVEPPLLAVDRLEVTFGAHRVLDEVSLRVEPGEIVGLIGANGAGKTTLVDALTGFVSARGRVEFDGVRLGGPPYARARRGLSRTWQSLELFDDLTVREGLLVAVERPGPTAFLRDLLAPRRRGRVEVDWALELVGIESVADMRPRELSLGTQKLVGVARALASRPRLLLLDEPAAGLDSDESRELGARISKMVEHGVTVLLIDHDVDLVLGVCDRVVVLDFGKIVAEGTAAEVRTDEKVVAAYLGVAAAAVEAEPRPSAVRDAGR